MAVGTEARRKDQVDDHESSDVGRRRTRLLARVSSKGQVTIPKAVREKLGIAEGDTVMFLLEDELDDQQTVMTRIPNLMELAGSVEVPEHLQGRSWEEIRDIARRERAKKWR